MENFCLPYLFYTLTLMLNIGLTMAESGEHNEDPNDYTEDYEVDYYDYAEEENYECGENETVLYDGVCKLAGYQEKKPAKPKQFTDLYVHVEDTEVREIKEEEKKIEIIMKYYIVWKDHRIRVDPTYAKAAAKHDIVGVSVNWLDIRNGWIDVPPIWYPDAMKLTGVSREKKLKDPFTTLIYTIAKSNSNLWPDSARNQTRIVQEIDILLSLFCNVNLALFPMDVLKCTLEVSNEDDKRLKLHFSPKTVMDDKLTLMKDGFNITRIFKEGKNNSFVGFEFELERTISPYIYEYYLPCAAIVFVSQISFIIPPSSIPGRIGLLATLFLTLANLFINHMVCFIYVDLYSTV